MLLTDTQVSKLCKAFANNSSANIKLSKTQLHKIGQSGGFFGRLLVPLLKIGLSLMKNILKLLAKSGLIPLGLTAAASVTNVPIQKKLFGSGMTTLIISNGKMNDIIKLVKSLKEFDLLIKDLSKTIKNKTKEQKGGFLGMLLGTLVASLLGNLLTSKATITAGEGTMRASQDFYCRLIL